MNPKPNKKLSLAAESYGTIAGRGFFRQSQVLLSSIVGKLMSPFNHSLLSLMFKYYILVTKKLIAMTFPSVELTSSFCEFPRIILLLYLFGK